MSSKLSKQELIERIARKFDVSVEDVFAVLYNETTGLSAELCYAILGEVVNRDDQMFVCLITKNSSSPNPLRNLDHYYYIEPIVESIQLFFYRSSYQVELFLCNARIGDTAHWQHILEKHPGAGVVVINTGDAGTLQKVCEEAAYPCVFINYPTGSDMSKQYAVMADNHGATVAEVEHLYQLGHRRIAYIHGMLNQQVGHDRLEGYYAALHKLGIDKDTQLVYPGNWNPNRASDAVKKFLSLDVPPTAIVAANDMMAQAAITALNDAGLAVPEEMSVMGFDDSSIATQTTPLLTSVRQPLTFIGRKAAEYIMTLLEGEKPPSYHHIFPLELIIRDSTAPAP